MQIGHLVSSHSFISSADPKLGLGRSRFLEMEGYGYDPLQSIDGDRILLTFGIFETCCYRLKQNLQPIKKRD